MTDEAERGLPLLVVVEGANDVFFLRAISTILHRAQPELPDLADLESKHHILFLPVCGSNCRDQVQRVAMLNKRIFHLLDREVEPETSDRQKIVAEIQQMPGCVAVLTRKRALENYLHPSAIMEASGIDLSFTDDDDVTAMLARQLLAGKRMTWNQLMCKGQKRLKEKAKKILNVQAVQFMTPELLAERDLENELIGWLRTIKDMLHKILPS